MVAILNQLKFRLPLLIFLSLLAIHCFSQSPSIGIIGSATPGGWNTDTDLIPDQDDPNRWSLILKLTPGDCAFRMNHSWVANWSSGSFPSGKGTQDGPNIPVKKGGKYRITFNSNTGDYSFVPYSDIGIYGYATPGGFDYDMDMYQETSDTNQYSLSIQLTDGEVIFRANDAWVEIWGNVDFPTGVGIANGPFIPVPEGKYLVHFNKSTGEYFFEKDNSFNSIGIIGDATAGVWDVETDLKQDEVNADLWTARVMLEVGELKFRGNHDWIFNWGGNSFPNGIAIRDGYDIQVLSAGEYEVSFNTKTLEYNFEKIIHYRGINILFTTPSGDSSTITAMTRDPDDASIWRLRIDLSDGFLVFNADTNLIFFWGGVSFPSGIATHELDPIPVPAGRYNITFNSTTAEYNFDLVKVFGTVGIIGTATSIGAWDEDVKMTRDSLDNYFWYINSIQLKDGEVKFRADDDWSNYWGNVSFPTGIGSRNGRSVPVTAGNYRVTLNTETGEYKFEANTSAVHQTNLNPEVVRISPNPAREGINISLTSDELNGDVQIALFNPLGARVKTFNLPVDGTTRLDVSDLPAGNYLMYISNGKYAISKKVILIR